MSAARRLVTKLADGTRVGGHMGKSLVGWMPCLSLWSLLCKVGAMVHGFLSPQLRVTV